MARSDAAWRRAVASWRPRRSALFALAAALGLGGWALAASYEYDAMGRLIEVAQDDGSIVNYSYDASGNRTQVALSIDPTYFSVNDVNVTEGGNLVFTVTRSGMISPPHSVDYATGITGTATSGTDFTATSGTLNFASNEDELTVTVVTTSDAVHEENETVHVNLTLPTNGAAISDSQGVGTINNDDAGPAFSVNDPTVTEGGNLVFTVTKTGSTALSHNVSYATADGAATAGTDYTATSGSLSFASGETSKTVTVATTSESVFENNETVLLNLSSATNGASISDSQGSGTINNDDSGPAFSVNDISANEGDTLVFTVTKSGPTAVSHNVSYATANNTAGSGSDYTAASGTLTFASGETTKTVNVATTENSTFEATETLYLNLSSATSSATISDSQGVGTIYDDDGSPPTASYYGAIACSSSGPDGSGNYWIYWCHQFTVSDPDGGTAYFQHGGVNYANTWDVMYAYTVYNIYVPEWEATYPYGDVPTSVYTYDTTGQNKTYTISCCYSLSPIVLDLDGDGLELVSALTSTIAFDVDGDGARERTGWVGADDGLLALDRNSDGRIASGDEISFVNDLPGARTDLEGLRAFDSSGDGVLDKDDLRFSEFLVWRDRNQDGVSQPEELFALADLGIVALDLAIAPTGAQADGAVDNVVTGLSRFMRADGRDGLIGDAAFSYESLELQDLPVAAARSAPALASR